LHLAALVEADLQAEAQGTTLETAAKEPERGDAAVSPAAAPTPNNAGSSGGSGGGLSAAVLEAATAAVSHGTKRPLELTAAEQQQVTRDARLARFGGGL